MSSQIYELNYVKIILSTVGILYIWSLPILSNLGFASKNGNSISEFISTPQATGAMASISFMPLCLMWEYQDIYISHFKKNWPVNNILYKTLTLFQIFYSAFLICCVSYVPSWLHTSVVIVFCLSFLVHAFLICFYIEINLLTKFILFIGTSFFILLPFADGMYFWAFECIGFTSMLLFTPIDWILLSKKKKEFYQLDDT